MESWRSGNSRRYVVDIHDKFQFDISCGSGLCLASEALSGSRLVRVGNFRSSVLRCQHFFTTGLSSLKLLEVDSSSIVSRW